MNKTIQRVLLTAVLVIAFTASARSAELRIGFASEPSSLDPHFHQLVPNEMWARHVFDKLLWPDEKQRMQPALAVSWKAVDDTTWEFNLRKGVKWHDGTEFTAEDVAFSVGRAPNVPNSPGGYGTFLNQIASTRVVDRYTIRFKTKSVFPLQPEFMSKLFIVQKKAAQGATTPDYNSGKAMVGTGPYKLVEYVRGDHVTYARNDDYWGPKEPWDKVTIIPITSGPSRVAALLAGDVDMIDFVPPTDVASLKRNKKVNVYQTPTLQFILLNLAQKQDVWPFITAHDGSALKENPLAKFDVRKAISLAVNRQAIVDRVMEGNATPVGQMVPSSFSGYSPKLRVDSYDPEQAKALLKKAGYPNGFRITLHGPNDRYINDDKVLLAVAQMLTRIGIRSKVEVMPKSVFFSRANKREFSLFLTGNGGTTGEASSVLRVLLHSYDKDGGYGLMNRGRYSNREMDLALEEALRTVDSERRKGLLEKAMEISIRELGVIPLHAEVYTWATRKGLSYLARFDTKTLAMGVRPTN